MTHIAGKAATDAPPILHAAIALLPQIRAAREKIEAGRRLPPAPAGAIKEAGNIFGMVMPRPGAVPNSTR